MSSEDSHADRSQARAASPRSRRARIATSLCILAAAAYLGASARHAPDDRYTVRDSHLLVTAPRLLRPGWHLVPRGIFRLHSYPKGETALSFGPDGTGSFLSPEGAAIEGSGRVAYTINTDHVLDLHALTHGEPDRWLAQRLREAIEETLAEPRAQLPTPENTGTIQREARRRLTTLTAPAGLRIDDLQITRLAVAAGRKKNAVPDAPRPTATRKVLWLAIDSFDWDIIRPLMKAGRMPNLARLVRTGAWGNLRAFPPLLSPVIWTSVATGKSPEKHGIIDFVATDPGTGAVLPVTSTLRKARAFWNIFSDSDVSVGVIAWWASFPAEKVKGFLCADRIAYQLFGGRMKDSARDDSFKTYPPSLYGRIADLIEQPSSIRPAELARFIDLTQQDRFSKDDIERVEQFRTVLAATKTYTRIGMRQFAAEPTDLRVIYFEGPDTTSHLFMPFVPPAVGSISPTKEAWFGHAVPEFYVYQDELIGRFVQAFADQETTILVSSDHGFKTGDQRPAIDSRIGHGKAAQWHAKEGIVVLAGKDIRPGVRVLGATVMDLVPTLLALYGLPVGEDMDGKVLTAAIDPAFLKSHAPFTTATYETGRRPRPVASTPITAEDQELLEKLRSLGYVQQDKPTAQINQGTILLQEGRYDEAVASFERALRQVDRDPVRMSLARALRLAGRFDEAEAQLGRLAGHGWKPSVVLTERALLQRDRGNLDAAARMLREAADLDPNSAEIAMQLGRLRERQERWEDAVTAYQRACALGPAQGEPFNKLGVTLQKIGRTQEAIGALSRAVKVEPDLAGPYNNLGLIYRERGEKDKARAILETGLTMAPRSPILHNSLGSLLFDAGDTSLAIEHFEKAIDLDPDYAEALSNLGVIYSQRRDAAKTIEYLSRLIELEPDNAQAYLSVGLAQLTLGRTDDAVATVRGLLARDPENVKAVIMLAEILLRRGDPGEAAGLFERAGELDGRIPRVWNSLAQCYLALQRTAAARDALKRSLSIDPDQPEVARKLTALGG